MNKFSNARKIFKAAIEAVQPDQMIEANLVRNNDTLYFDDQVHRLNKNVYVVGFGKAVGGMCKAVQKIIGNHLVAGILSVPHGLRQHLSSQNAEHLLPLLDEKLTVIEGANNNYPDYDSYMAAGKIIDLCQKATESDLVIALVSGGGSALLPRPVDPLTLEEKLITVKTLASKGATIQELNVVRKNLSIVKGGRLADMTEPAKMWSFILSDIIGDPVDLIASGPTVPKVNSPEEALRIIQNYGLEKELTTACNVLRNLPIDDKHSQHVYNKIVGNNTIAINNAVRASEKLGYKTFVISKSLCGEARYLGEAFVHLCNLILNKSACRQSFQNDVHRLFEKHGLNAEDLARFCLHFLSGAEKCEKMCIISGGETTVSLPSNHGTGGRNQEMVLSFGVVFANLCNAYFNTNLKSASISFLSGGTDGQDGPTSEAGAVFSSDDVGSVDLAFAQKALDEHNSFSYFQKCGGSLTTGLTGTNVMDIQVLLVEKL